MFTFWKITYKIYFNVHILGWFHACFEHLVFVYISFITLYTLTSFFLLLLPHHFALLFVCFFFTCPFCSLFSPRSYILCPFISVYTYLFLILKIIFFSGYLDINTIRGSSQISRLVYLSFRYDSRKAIRNIVYLCSNNRSYTAPPFRLAKVIPIDLHPQTPFVEIILIFERKPIRNI